MRVKAGSTVDDFIRKLNPERKEIVAALRAIIEKAAPNSEASIKWGSPWWTDTGLLCTVYAAGSHINFGFSRGAELDDPEELLEGTGKGMRHIKIESVKDIKKSKFAALIKQAVELNRTSPKAAR